jgi:hypothetical protein
MMARSVFSEPREETFGLDSLLDLCPQHSLVQRNKQHLATVSTHLNDVGYDKCASLQFNYCKQHRIFNENDMSKVFEYSTVSQYTQSLSPYVREQLAKYN